MDLAALALISSSGPVGPKGPEPSGFLYRATENNVWLHLKSDFFVQVFGGFIHHVRPYQYFGYTGLLRPADCLTNQ
jgi:hypothetical protein